MEKKIVKYSMNEDNMITKIYVCMLENVCRIKYYCIIYAFLCFWGKLQPKRWGVKSNDSDIADENTTIYTLVPSRKQTTHAVSNRKDAGNSLFG